MRRSDIEAMLEAREAGATVLVTDLASGRNGFIPRDSGDFAEAIVAAAHDAIRRDRSGIVEHDGSRYFLHVVNPALRMFIVGAVHITQALAPIAELCGYRVTVIDPRRSFASPERFPGVEIRHDWPDEALDEARLDRRSAVVTLTHDPKLDDPALHVALRSPAFYIGSLGSRRTHAARKERLEAAGFSAGEMARIHGPVGLDIAAVSPAEIATAIVAEVTRALRQDRPE